LEIWLTREAIEKSFFKQCSWFCWYLNWTCMPKQIYIFYTKGDIKIFCHKGALHWFCFLASEIVKQEEHV
jgi:hypothetical protein